MSATTRKRQKTSKALTTREIRDRLREARERNEELGKKGKLPSPSKKWSDDSLQALRKALSEKVSLSK